MFRSGRFQEFGAGDGIRTRDINLGKVALYQLSYSREANYWPPRGERHHCRALGAKLSNRTLHSPSGLELSSTCGFTGCSHYIQGVYCNKYNGKCFS
jgi:hypothetical protein